MHILSEEVKLWKPNVSAHDGQTLTQISVVGSAKPSGQMLSQIGVLL